MVRTPEFEEDGREGSTPFEIALREKLKPGKIGFSAVGLLSREGSDTLALFSKSSTDPEKGGLMTKEVADAARRFTQYAGQSSHQSANAILGRHFKRLLAALGTSDKNTGSESIERVCTDTVAELDALYNSTEQSRLRLVEAELKVVLDDNARQREHRASPREPASKPSATPVVAEAPMLALDNVPTGVERVVSSEEVNKRRDVRDGLQETIGKLKAMNNNMRSGGIPGMNPSAPRETRQKISEVLDRIHLVLEKIKSLEGELAQTIGSINENIKESNIDETLTTRRDGLVKEIRAAYEDAEKFVSNEEIRQLLTAA